jgi:hydroxymethylpyrimidine/phosphomethylpyrimidine kinase
MLANRALVELVAAWADRGALPYLVVDPVMVAASGGQLLEPDAHLAYRSLIAQAVLVTPNVPEAELLCGEKILDHADLAEAARSLVRLGAGAALVKGGHLKGRESVDVLFHNGEVTEFRAPRIDSVNTHGTGCTLSAAITAGLAVGMPLVAAVERAKRYVTAAITSAAKWQLGSGPGPLDHGVWGGGAERR